jgi:hypothetical protein
LPVTHDYPVSLKDRASLATARAGRPAKSR